MAEGETPVYQHECEREPEIRMLTEEVSNLKGLPTKVAELKVEVSHITKSVDTMCLEIKRLTEVIQSFASMQLKQEALKEDVEKLGKIFENSECKLDKCAARCNIDMTAVNKTYSDLEKRVIDLEGVIRILKWAGAVVGGTLLISGVYFIFTLVMHIYGGGGLPIS